MLQGVNENGAAKAVRGAGERTLVERLYPVVVEIAVPRGGFGEPRRRAIDAALAGTDYMPDRRPRDGEWVAYRFRNEAAAWTFKENVARAQLVA